ncbi:calcium/proton exchanger cax [Bradyrhizobium sp. USDA 3650]
MALFILASGETAVVQAQVTGSIIGTSLFGLGIAILIGGLSRQRQTFNPAKAGLLSTLLILSVIALLLPAVFDYTGRQVHLHNIGLTDEELSLGASLILLLLYAGNIVYTLITHRDAFADGEADGKPAWGLALSIGIVIGCTAIIAIEAEILSDVLTQTATALRISPTFLGVVVLALVGDKRRHLRGELVRSPQQHDRRVEYLRWIRPSSSCWWLRRFWSLSRRSWKDR